MAAATTNKFRLALVQMAVGANKAQNLSNAAKLVKEAAKNNAAIVALPECFNSPYGTKYFPEYAEKIPDDQTCQELKKMASLNEIYLLGGSIPERDGEKLFNTATAWSPKGELLATHRKIHLFDIDVPGKITFKESEALSPGDSFTIFETPLLKIGVGICYDIRFADLAQIYCRKEGCKLLIYPGAFNMTTGPAHWELLGRARALDNSVYVAMPSPARDENADYVAWGHSSIMGPWGDVLAKAGTSEEIIYADIDLDYLDQIRRQIPITVQRRNDLYDVVKKK